MSGPSDTDQIRQMIAAAHEQMEAFARSSYHLDGRGALMVTFPRVARGRTSMIQTDMRYHQLEDLRQLTAGSGESAEILIRMVETYDPDTQAVILASIEGGNPVSMKWRFDASTRPSLFPAWKSFMDEHEDCPDDPHHLLFHIWLPPELPDEARVTFTCVCGARITVLGTRAEGLAIVAACRKNGIPVTESDGAAGIQ